MAHALVDFEEYLKRTLEQKAPEYAASQHLRADGYQGFNPNTATTWTTPQQASSQGGFQNVAPQQAPQFFSSPWPSGQNVQQPAMGSAGQLWQGARVAFEQAPQQNFGPAYQGQQQNLQGHPAMHVFAQGYPNNVSQGYNQLPGGSQLQVQLPLPNSNTQMAGPQVNAQGMQMGGQNNLADLNSMSSMQQGSNQIDPSRQQTARSPPVDQNQGYIMSAQPGVTMQQSGYQQQAGSGGYGARQG